jgi:hypothetical protein
MIAVRAIALAAAALAAGCSAKASTIPNTRVPDTQANRDIIELIEGYRLALEDQKIDQIAKMTSSRYWEDDATAAGSDDWGHSKLDSDVRARFLKSRDIRYSLRYMNIERRCPQQRRGNEGCVVLVDVLLDASFTVTNAHGIEERRDMRDQNQIVLEWDKRDNAWKFVAGL